MLHCPEWVQTIALLFSVLAIIFSIITIAG